MTACTCDRDTIINDPGMAAPRCPIHDPKPQAVTPYVKEHGTVTNWDADKIREHMEGGDD